MSAVQGPAARAAERTIRLLEYDPELGATLRPERRAEAWESARATLREVPRGACTPAELIGEHEPPYGVLLLDGLANRTVVLDGVVSAQLLGRGDLVRVARHENAPEPLVETVVHWTVFEPLPLALLDEAFLLSVRRWPELVAALFARLAAQEERRELHRALSQLPRVEDRIHALLWLLAERWGRVSPQGVILRLRLTHELIGRLVGAKRPTVSLALKQLEERGIAHRRTDGSWLLEQAWMRPPTGAADPAADGAGLVEECERPASPRPASPPDPALADVRARVERMRRLHARVRQEVADTLAHTAAVRERSARLRH
ncbi:MAG TPA: helix-turn-helix domain-containing protein [Conexibacter sp.]|nr:helix-turn-helix domain-containing protein [Conexibacter sp.]